MYQKNNFEFLRLKWGKTLALLTFFYLSRDCKQARSFFLPFLRCNPNRDINNAIKSAYKSLAKRHKAEKRVWVLLYFRYRQGIFLISWFSSSSSKRSSREYRLQILSSVHASYTFTAEEKNNLHRILLWI